MIDLQFQNFINQELKRFFATRRKFSSQFDKRLPQLIDQIATFTLRGGDRMRPYFCWLGYKIAKNQPHVSHSRLNTILPVLLALELTHTFALIHDDIMDEADTRRGGPTIHAYFTKILRNSHLATSLAILAGDLAYIWAEELFDEVKNEEYLRAKVLFNTMREETVYGQVSDMWGMKERSREELLTMYELKTARYSVEKPLLVGATLGNGDTKLASQLSNYGIKVGTAFQIKDDLLGVFGEEKITGKSTTDDIREGKWTLLIAETAQRVKKEQKHEFFKILGDKNASTENIKKVREWMIISGAKALVEKKMQNLIKDGLEAFSGLPGQLTAELRSIAQFVVEREI